MIRRHNVFIDGKMPNIQCQYELADKRSIKIQM
jgi:hypothetical protein